MNELQLLLKGMLAGLAISAPVGPVNVLCISRTLAKNWISGVTSGMGAATADTIYGSIAGFSISFVIGFLIREEFWIRLFGGILLLGIGVFYYCRRPQSLEEARGNGSGQSEYASAFLLTMTNPTTVLSFLAVLAALGTGQHREWWLTLFLVVGIFCGSMVWWTVLAVIASLFRERFDDRGMLWMNRAAGLAIGGFGAVTLMLARR